MEHKESLIIGDWSEDGHGKTETINFNCTHGRDEIREAYQKFVDKHHISLHDYTDDSILVEYEDYALSQETYHALELAGIDFSRFDDFICEDDSYYMTPHNVAVLFLEMVRCELDHFQFEFLKERSPINGYWQKGFNHMIGYGVFQ